MEDIFTIDLSDTPLADFDTKLETFLANAYLAFHKELFVDVSCNPYMDSRTVRSILVRTEVSNIDAVIVDVSQSGVSPNDLFSLVTEPRIRLLICHSNNIDTDVAIALSSRVKQGCTIDLRWNCIIKSLFLERVRSEISTLDVLPPKLDDRLKQVVLGYQFGRLIQPVTFARLGNPFALKDDLLTDEFFRHEVGFCWSELVLGSDRRNIEQVADSVIGAIPQYVLDAALRKCVVSEDADLPRLKLAKFGSCVNGFGSRKSDIDLVVTTVNGEDRVWLNRRFRSAESQKKLSQDFLYYLRRFLEDQSEVELVLHARVPVIKIGQFNLGMNMHVAVDITFMNTVCVCNSGLLRNYAKLSEKTFRLVHLVKIWARNNDLISSSDNGFTFPTSYAWVLMAIYFMQVRLHAVPRLFKLDGPVEDVWGCRSSTFVNRACVGDLGSSSFTRNAPSSPLTLFTLFLHFLAHEADDLVMDIATLNAHADRKDSPLHVLDPIEIGRVVTKNVTSEHWEFIKTNAAMYLERLERIGSYGSFLDVVSTSHREPRSHTTVHAVDTVQLHTGRPSD